MNEINYCNDSIDIDFLKNGVTNIIYFLSVGFLWKRFNVLAFNELEY